MFARYFALLLVGACWLLTPPAHAQWTNDPQANTRVRDVNGVSEWMPLTAPGPNNSLWVSWFEKVASTNYQVRLQLLDATGRPQLGEAGLLVSNKPQATVLYRYDLDVDNQGNAILAFQDTRSADGSLQVVVYKVSPTGQQLWGADGIQLLDATTTRGVAPTICRTSQGNVVISWNADATADATHGTKLVPLVKLSPAGTILWATPMRIQAPSRRFSRPAMVSVPGSDDVVVEYVEETGVGVGTSTVFAQRYNTSGAAVWNAPVQVSTKTIPYAFFPETVPDGGGGYFVQLDTTNPVTNSTLKDVYVQRVAPDGTLPWGATGAEVLAGTATQRTSGSLQHVTSRGELWSAVNVLNSDQSQSGVSVQRLSAATGAVQLGTSGATVLAPSANYYGVVGFRSTGTGLLLTYSQNTSVVNRALWATKLNYNAQFAFASPVELSSVASPKNYYQTTYLPQGLVTVWQDERLDDGIYAQIINDNGLLGVTPTLTSLTPTSGPVGTSVTLAGQYLSSATGVSFNGTAAVFSANADGTLTATVPGGATSGSVTVTTPSGVSNGLSFTVTYPDLVVTTTTPIAAGIYNTITVNSPGVGTLAGNVVVNTTVTVNSGGTLNDGCAVIGGAGSFTLAAGGTLGICAAAGISSSGPTGAVQVTGARSFSTDASYVYNGTSTQTTGSGLPGQVRNLTTTNSNNVTLSNSTSATQVVTVAGSGNLVLDGNALTLLSSASGTALLVNSGTGLVTGATGVAQRYLATANLGLGYRQYSAPVSGSTVADLATSGFLPEVSQAAAYNSSATPGTVRPYPTVFGYDQSRLASTTSNLTPFNKGWYVPAGTGAPLAVGQGYTVHLAGTELVDFVGTFTSGSQTVSLSRGPGADAGLALVGNPYPAPLDWSLLNALTDRPGVDGAIWVFQSSGPYAGSYRSYVNGQGSGSIVPMGQGFFVRVSPGQSSASLTFRNAHRLTAPDPTTMQRTQDLRPRVTLELRTPAGGTDQFIAYAEAGATPGLDAQFDAAKLTNPTGLNLSSAAASGEYLSIDGRPVFGAGTELPLQVGVPAAGTYQLATAELKNLPAGLASYLHDTHTGQTLALPAGSSYSFQVTAAEATALVTGRFSLQFAVAAPLAGTPAALAAQVLVYPNPAHAQVCVALPGVAGASAGQAELLSTLGQVVHRQQATLPAGGTTLVVATDGLAPGVYVLRLTLGSTTVTKRVVLE